MRLRSAAEVIEFDDYEEEEEYEPLPCSMAYVVVCLWLPVLNGCIHGFTGWGKRLTCHFLKQVLVIVLFNNQLETKQELFVNPLLWMLIILSNEIVAGRSVQTLYFRDNDWPLWRLGIAVACGFTLRLFSQGVQVQVGI